jgi:hypothetical protein
VLQVLDGLPQFIQRLAGLAQDPVYVVGVGFVAVGDLRDDRPELCYDEKRAHVSRRVRHARRRPSWRQYVGVSVRRCVRAAEI